MLSSHAAFAPPSLPEHPETSLPATLPSTNTFLDLANIDLPPYPSSHLNLRPSSASASIPTQPQPASRPPRPDTAPAAGPALTFAPPSTTDAPFVHGDDNLGEPDGERKTRFVHKLHRMVEDPECQDTISWSPSGNSVIISDVDAFCAGVLGKHFKHNNFSSFIRQLNMYGFYKVNKSHRAARASGQPQTWEFSHPHFLRGRTDLLDTIRRRTLDTESVRFEATRDLQNDMSVSYARLQSQLGGMSEALAASQAENAALWGFVAQLRNTLAQVVDRCHLSNLVAVPSMPIPPSRVVSPGLKPSLYPPPPNPQGSAASDPPIFAHTLPPLPSASVVPPSTQHHSAYVSSQRPVTAPSMSSQGIALNSSALIPRPPAPQPGYRPVSMEGGMPGGGLAFSTLRPRPRLPPGFPQSAALYNDSLSLDVPGQEPPFKRRALEQDVVPEFGFELP